MRNKNTIVYKIINEQFEINPKGCASKPEDDKKIYNNSESPFMTMIIDYESQKSKKKNILNLIPILLNQTFQDIQIVILIKYSNSFYNNIIKKYSHISKKIDIYILNNENWINSIIDTINKIKGKYLIYFNEFITLTNNELYLIYNMTKGKLNNIFKYLTKNNSILNLIRTKILRDIIDSSNNLNSLEEIINCVNFIPIEKFNYVPVAYSSSNNYISLVYTSMLSVLSNKGYYTFILFFIIIPKDFSEVNIRFLESLYEQYDYFNITFIRMDDKYKNAYNSGKLSIHVYFRYSLGELIPNLDKIIYLDSDTICLTDLLKFYNINFRGKLILGRILYYDKNNNIESFSINSGILLLNLKEMRKMKMEKIILKILKSGFGHNKIKKINKKNSGTNIQTVDQALLNIYFAKYIGLFPPEYNARHYDYKTAIKFNRDIGNYYDGDYFYFSYKYPSIRHYCGDKYNLAYQEEWNYYARKSKYFHKISNSLRDIYNMKRFYNNYNNIYK